MCYYSVMAVLDTGERTNVNDDSTTSTITRWSIDDSYDPSSYALWDLDTSGSAVDVNNKPFAPYYVLVSRMNKYFTA